MQSSSAMACQCHEHHVFAVPSPAVTRPHWRTATVTLVRGGRSSVVRPAALETTRFRGVLAVRLDALWTAARLEGASGELRFDLVGEGGFRPTRRGHPTLPGPLLGKGCLLLHEGRVEWDTDAGLPCAYRVKGLVMMVAYDVEDATLEATRPGG